MQSDVLLTFAAKVGVTLLTLISTVIVARALGPDGRGAYAVGLSLTLLLIQFGSFGLQVANPYFAARDPATLPRVIANSIWLTIMLGATLALIGAGIWIVFPSLLRGLTGLQIAIVLCGVPGALGMVLFQNILLGEGRMVPYNAVEVGLSVVSVAAVAIFLLGLDLGVTAAVTILAVVFLVGALAFLSLLVRHDPPVARPDLKLLNVMLRYGSRVYVATLLAYLVGRSSIFLINSYLGGSAAGLYSVAQALADGMYLFPSVVAVNLLPRVARGLGHEDSAAVFRTVAVLFACVCVVSMLLAEPVIELLFGSQYLDAGSLYRWMVPGIFSLGMLNILSHHFAGRGFPLEAVLVWVPGLALNLAIMFVFLPANGAYVAAIASSASYVLLLLLHMRLFAKESGGYGSLRPRAGDVAQLGSLAVSGLRSRGPWTE